MNYGKDPRAKLEMAKQFKKFATQKHGVNSLYFDKIVVVNFKNFGDVMYFVYVLSGLLLFIGGFLSKPTLSIITGVLLFLCTIYFMVTHLPADFTRIQISSFLVYLWPAGIGLYFAGSGG